MTVSRVRRNRRVTRQMTRENRLGKSKGRISVIGAIFSGTRHGNPDRIKRKFSFARRVAKIAGNARNRKSAVTTTLDDARERGNVPLNA